MIDDLPLDDDTSASEIGEAPPVRWNNAWRIPAPVLEPVVVEQALAWPDRARAHAVVDNPTSVAAAEFLLGIKALQDQIDAKFDPHIRRAHEVHKALCDDKKQTKEPLLEAELILKGALVRYDIAQEKIREETERRLQLQALKDAEERRLAQAVAMTEEAQTTGDQGLLTEVEDLLSAPLEAPVVSVTKTTPKVSGIAYRDAWKANPSVDIKKLAAAVAAGTVNASYLLPNMPALNQLAKATKGTQQIPGVTFFNDRGVAAGAR